MNLIHISKRKHDPPITFAEVSKAEALALIESLVGQLRDGNPNSSRKEFHTRKGEYFSIAVLESA